jgi:hypothetical protein
MMICIWFFLIETPFKWVFIRFNPDSYNRVGNNVNFATERNLIKNKKMNPKLETTLISLKEMIENQIERINKQRGGSLKKKILNW